MKQEEFFNKMKEIQEEKKEILNSIFISKEEAENIKEFNKKQPEIDLMIRCAELSAKNDKVTEILGNILRENDPKGENKLLQEVFTQFYTLMDEFQSMGHLKKLHKVLEAHKKT